MRGRSSLDAVAECGEYLDAASSDRTMTEPGVAGRVAASTSGLISGCSVVSMMVDGIGVMVPGGGELVLELFSADMLMSEVE